MVSVAPYLIRAYHQWMEDNALTPHVLVDCTKPGVSVPKSFVQQDKIALNIGSNATDGLAVSNESISFKARFNGKSHDIYVPINAVLTIYAGENGEGMFFENENQVPPVEKQTKPNLTLLD